MSKKIKNLSRNDIYLFFILFYKPSTSLESILIVKEEDNDHEEY